jgi:MFS family permease
MLSPFFATIKQLFLGKKTKIFLNYILGPVVFAWLGWAIYRQVQHQSDLHESWNFIRDSFTGTQSWKIILVVLLMALQWAVEARKWQLLAARIQPVSFGEACRSVLAGQALAFNTPNRLGEPVGRVVFLGEGNRLRGIALSVTGSVAQLLITFLAGLAGLLYLRLVILPTTQPGRMPLLYNGFVLGVTVATGLLLLLYYRLAWVAKWIVKWRFTSRHRYLVDELGRFHWQELTRFLLLSAGRYVLFMVQYVLLLQVFKVHVSVIETACLVSVMFLVIAIIPTIAFAELGFRGQISLQLFGLVSANSLGIIATTAGIWIINLVIPAIAGSIFLLGVRLFRTKREYSK